MLSTHEVAADVSTEAFLRNLEVFYTSVEDLLMEHTDAWVVLAKEHMTPKTMQKKKEMQAKQREFADILEVLRKLRDRAAGYLQRLGLAHNKRFLKVKPSLERWRSLTFTDFRGMSDLFSQSHLKSSLTSRTNSVSLGDVTMSGCQAKPRSMRLYSRRILAPGISTPASSFSLPSTQR